MAVFTGLLRRLFGDSNPVELEGPRTRKQAIATKAGGQQAPADGGQLARGKLTQFGSRGSGAPLDVVLGLDFGTSCVKAFVQAPAMQGRRSTAIDFGGLGHPRCSCLLPTMLADLGDGRVALRVHHDAEVHADDLKVALMNTQCSDGAIARATAFLALAIRESRGHFLRARQADYGHLALRWSMNLGIPSAGYDDELVRGRFLRIARAAWALSLDPGNPSLDHVSRVTDSLQSNVPLSDQCEVNVVPEIAAEVVGYAKSSRRRRGLHVMVDVGASTLDVCSFVLHESGGDDSYNLLTAWVGPYGVRELANVLRAEEHVSGRLRAMDPVPTLGTGIRRIEQADEHIAKCRRVLMQVLVDAKVRRDPKSDRWGYEIPVFHCGGGSLLPEYETVLAGASERLEAFYNTRLRVTRLDVPDDLFSERSINPPLFKRLAVAHGLSHDSFDIGDVVPPSEIGDVAGPKHISRGDAYVGKEHV